MFSRLMARLSDRNEENHDLRKVLSWCYLKIRSQKKYTFNYRYPFEMCTSEKYTFMLCEGSSLGASSTLGFSHPESLTEEIPTKKSFLKVFLKEMPELFSSQLNFYFITLVFVYLALLHIEIASCRRWYTMSNHPLILAYCPVFCGIDDDILWP